MTQLTVAEHLTFGWKYKDFISNLVFSMMKVHVFFKEINIKFFVNLLAFFLEHGTEWSHIKKKYGTLFLHQIKLFICFAVVKSSEHYSEIVCSFVYAMSTIKPWTVICLF